MAPFTKEAENAVTTTTSAPAATAPKSPNDTGRTQPVALEIPVTINGAHTVAGSDKREPFSETTQTVLVFGHGAVVRVTASLAAGQLVFLTNEKTKKEVVCQVVKSKSGGTGSNYVELQFTEASPGFWGLRTPAAPTAPVVPPQAPATAPRPVTSTPPVPTAVAPVLPPAPKPVPVAPKPVTPAAVAPPPKPVIPSPAPGVTPSVTAPLAHTSPVPLVSVPLPPPLSAAIESPVAQAVPPAVSPVTVAPPQSATPAPDKTAPPIPVPPVHDYAKEIDALFTIPSSTTSRPAPAAPPEPKAAALSSSPSSEQLKLEAARLQAQLSSMLFTETHATNAAPVPPKLETPVPEVAKKVLEIAHEPIKLAPVVDAKPKVTPPPTRKPLSSLSADEEVKIPSWLAPLSQNLEPAVAEPPTSAAQEPAVELAPLPEPSLDTSALETSSHADVALFGGQMFTEAPPENAEDTSAFGSKKGLWIGLAAAIVLLAGGGVWYLRPGLFGSSAVVNAKPASSSVAAVAPSSVAPVPSPETKVAPPATATANPPSVPSNPAPAASQPAKNLQPVSSVIPSAPAPSTKNSVADRVTPTPEHPKKPAIGEVHLAAPVVSRGAKETPSGEPLPSIDTHNGDSAPDGLAAIPSAHHNQPAAPLAIGGDVAPAQLIKSIPPIYPSLAKTQHISGNVQIDALIDASGNVAELKIISGPPLLQRAAMDAVRQWKYKPAQLDGQATSMHLTVTVQFRAQ